MRMTRKSCRAFSNSGDIPPRRMKRPRALVILNTCSVRENADVRVFGNLGYFKNIKKTNPDLILAVCGCMMQQPAIVKRVKEDNPQVDIVFGTHNIHRFPELLANYQASGERVFEVLEDDDGLVEDIPVDPPATPSRATCPS